VTDPPYGHNNNDDDLISRREEALGKGISGPARPIANDGPEANAIFHKSLNIWFRLLSAGCCCCCCCCCGGGGPDPQFARWSTWMDEVFSFKQMIVWDKGPMGLGWHYRRSYETILVGEKPGAACRWFDTSSKIENVLRPDKFHKIIPTADQHPTEKPVSLKQHFVLLHADVGHIVLDPFMGSGTTGVACIQTNRKFIGIEIEQKYFDISVKRIEAAIKDDSERFDFAKAKGPEPKGLFDENSS